MSARNSDVPENTDPTRTLELLWGSGGRPSRGPKQGLSVERVISAAVEVCDAEGLAALSMRRVAARLGVGTASLYTYVPGKAELLSLMLDAMVGEQSLPHTQPGTWRQKFEAWARENWRDFQERPWMAQLASGRQFVGPKLLAWYDSALRVLADTGLSLGEMVSVVEAVDGYVRGLARSASDIAEAERRTGVPTETWQTAQDVYLATHVDLSRYPMVARFAAEGPLPTPVENFEFGLRRLLDGVEALIAARSTP